MSQRDKYIENMERILEFEVLPQVQKPGNYIGGEPNSVSKNHEDVLCDILLAFPDSYELGMSHNGTRILYHTVNRQKDFLAERCFAPLPDMGLKLKEKKIPLYSLESYRPMNSFHLVGISLQTELNFTNVPYILELGGVPAFSRDRSEQDPFIVGGGPCMANPEPVADFYDLFVIGDGELIISNIMKIVGIGRKEGFTRKKILQELHELEGIYIPSLWNTVENDWGEQVPTQEYSKGEYGKSKGVKRVWLENLESQYYPTKNPIPHVRPVHERFAVEVMRGCTQGCRFCQAGYWYRPNRELEPKQVIEIAKKGLKQTGELELGLLSLSTADYSQVENVTDYMVASSDFEDISLSLPSLRANSFGQNLAAKVAILSGGKSATFAPETGSERLRKLINKTISDQDMYDAAEGVFKNGFKKIKLYTMVGLPTEDLKDMDAFAGLIKGLHKIAQNFGRGNTIHVNMGIFIPKPVTPMQWVEFMDRDKVMSHINYIREQFRKIKTVRITWSDWGLSQVESFYSRGDRSLSKMIYNAYQAGKTFESFGEYFDYSFWEKTWKETDYPMDRVFSHRSLDQIFPWDVIHAGVNKAYLKVEYKKMYLHDSNPIPDCKWGDCQKCGIPGNYYDTKLASTDGDMNKAPSNIYILKNEYNNRIKQAREPYTYVFIYEKCGLSKFIPHHGLINHFEKALRRLDVPFHFTEGFNQRPVIKNAGALPLGLESKSEILLVQIEMELKNIFDWIGKINKILPMGINIQKIIPKQTAKFPLPKSILYSLSHEKDPSYVVDEFSKLNTLVKTDKRNRTVDVKNEILNLWSDSNELLVKLKTNPSGNSQNPYFIYGSLFNLPEEKVQNQRVLKLETEL